MFMGEVSMEDLVEVCVRAFTRSSKFGEFFEFEVFNGVVVVECDWKVLFVFLVIV